MSTVLITGSGGLLGQKLVPEFTRDFQVVATRFQANEFSQFSDHITTALLDIADSPAVEKVFFQFQPSVVLNAAAYTDVDGSETNRDDAFRGNVIGPSNLANLCQKFGAKLIHISTDYLFDGSAGPYSEEATPNPLGFYARTKFWGEEAIVKSGCQYLIVRSNVIYGTAVGVKQNFILWLLEKLRQQEPVWVVNDQFNNPTLADNLAQAIKEAVNLNLSGILNIAGSTYLSRYDFALAVARHFHLDESLIGSISTSELRQKSPRPLKGGLKIDKAKKLLKTKLLSVPEQLSILEKQLTRTNPLWAEK